MIYETMQEAPHAGSKAPPTPIPRGGVWVTAEDSQDPTAATGESTGHAGPPRGRTMDERSKDIGPMNQCVQDAIKTCSDDVDMDPSAPKSL